MGNEFPECHQQLLGVMQQLESHYRDMCDIEFTIEQGRLFMLQTRVGKRTAAAALRMAVEMEEEGLIDKREAVLRVQPAQLDQLLHPQFDPKATYTALAKGLNASPGAAVGKVYFTADDAEAPPRAGERRDPRAARDVARRPARHDRGRGHPHVARRARQPRRGRRPRHGQARDLRRRSARRSTSTAQQFVEVDGADRARGRRHLDQRHDRRDRRRRGRRSSRPSRPATSAPSSAGPTSFRRMQGAHQRRPARRTREVAREFGAEGIGLCRTEHMFLGDRLPIVQRMILADTPDEEDAALERARELQRVRLRRDPRGDGRPAGHGPPARPAAARVPARHRGAARQATPRASSTDDGPTLLAAAQLWREANPMLGTRGCRLGILKPGLYRMQVAGAHGGRGRRASRRAATRSSRS